MALSLVVLISKLSNVQLYVAPDQRGLSLAVQVHILSLSDSQPEGSFHLIAPFYFLFSPLHNSSFPLSGYSLSLLSIFKFEAFPRSHINSASPVTSPFLLILLLGETLSPRHTQILVRFISIVVRLIGI